MNKQFIVHFTTKEGKPVTEEFTTYVGIDILDIIREEIGDNTLNINKVSVTCPNVKKYINIGVPENIARKSGIFGAQTSRNVYVNPFSLSKYIQLVITPIYNYECKADGWPWSRKIMPLTEIQAKNKIYKVTKKIDTTEVQLSWNIDIEWLLYDWEEAGYPLDWYTK